MGGVFVTSLLDRLVKQLQIRSGLGTQLACAAKNAGKWEEIWVVIL